MSKEVFLIVGLGNPGPEYAHTRHNAGFDTMALLERHYQVTLGRKMLQGLLTEITLQDRKIVLCMPQTYMNASGECVGRLMQWYHCEPDHLMVIYDDIDLPPGRVRVRRDGGPGTHNGMRSIVETLGQQDFPRIRVGIGDRPAGQDLADWVLGRCDPETRETMETAFRKAAETAADWVDNGIDHAMQAGNRKD
ncbi:MAG: aminoacyl-tRNA hydrolase [Clostridiales bacterium]|nr:aminoacyl-tRNA hydrolase [Clostridiales bacterium]